MPEYIRALAYCTKRCAQPATTAAVPPDCKDSRIVPPFGALILCFPCAISQGGNEKKIRLFDLGRPDAQPLVLGNYADGNSCRGTIRSLVWDEGQGGVVGISASEDGLVRWWDLRTLEQTSSFDMGEPVNAMEMVHGGGTLSVTSGKTVHFLDILG